jgi:hypothetical protein
MLVERVQSVSAGVADVLAKSATSGSATKTVGSSRELM